MYACVYTIIREIGDIGLIIFYQYFCFKIFNDYFCFKNFSYINTFNRNYFDQFLRMHLNENRDTKMQATNYHDMINLLIVVTYASRV